MSLDGAGTAGPLSIAALLALPRRRDQFAAGDLILGEEGRPAGDACLDAVQPRVV